MEKSWEYSSVWKFGDGQNLRSKLYLGKLKKKGVGLKWVKVIFLFTDYVNLFFLFYNKIQIKEFT